MILGKRAGCSHVAYQAGFALFGQNIVLPVVYTPFYTCTLLPWRFLVQKLEVNHRIAKCHEEYQRHGGRGVSFFMLSKRVKNMLCGLTPTLFAVLQRLGWVARRYTRQTTRLSVTVKIYEFNGKGLKFHVQVGISPALGCWTVSVSHVPVCQP
jgi:hypothetical protein